MRHPDRRMRWRDIASSGFPAILQLN